MEKKNVKRTRIAAVRFTAAEFTAIEKKFKGTTCRQMSEYMRSCLLNKPITTRYRNESLDEFMLEMIRLRKEFSAVANNFNQSVKKLHTLRQIPEFRYWISSTEAQRSELLERLEVIQKWMDKTAVRWLQ